MKILTALLLATIAAAVFSLGSGDQLIPPGEVLAVLTGGEASPVAETIVLTLRLPRVALALAVGAALAMAGAATQAILRNPLAEPGLLGINAGAALAAMLVIVQFASVPESALPVSAFIGALAMAALIQVLSLKVGGSSTAMILIGIGLGAMAGAAASFISVFGPAREVQRALVWLAGSFQDARWIKLQWLAFGGLPAAALLWLMSRELDLIAMGETIASNLGQRMRVVSGLTTLGVATLAGAAVAAAGPIAFVGLAAPHLARKLIGRSHATLLPAAALLGALLLVLADLAARRALAPVQIPVGIAMALIGAPFFGYLLWIKRNDP